MIQLRQVSENPLVSIIVPSYNQGKFIKQTIDSVLQQDYRPIEVIIIDGASKDATLDVLHEYDGVPEVKWISEPDSGVVEAVNKGFARASGELGGIQSSDDCYLAGAVRQGVDALRGDLSLGFVFGDIIKIDAEGKELSRSSLKEFSMENVLSVITWIPQPSTFFRMDLAKTLGGWREEVPYAADTDLWMRMMLKADAKKIDVFIAKRRMHDSQRDKKGDRVIRDYARVIEDFFRNYGAPEDLRSAAEAGLLLQMNRYHYNEDETLKVKRLREALKLYPGLGEHVKVASRMPGVDRAKSAARRIAAALKR